MPLTMVLIFIVLLLLFRNYREPVVILLMIPLIFIGVVLGLAVTGKVFNFFCFPLRWYMGDGAMSRCVAFIDEDDVDASVPDRTYKYGGTGYADESGHGDSGLEYMRKLFNRNK